jgi:type IV secretion system protein VirB5
MSLAKELALKRTLGSASRYARTPYNRAREIWNDRQGALVRAAHSWRVMALASLLLAAGALAGMVQAALATRVQPYYIRVDASGEPVPVGPLPEHWTPGLAEIRYGLSEWIRWTRAVPLDPVLVRDQYAHALARMRQGAANRLNEWARTDPRLAGAGRDTVWVQVLGVVPVSGTHAYQARWIEEHRNAEGALKARETWTATFTVQIDPPGDERQIALNPIGLYIQDFQWSREL